MIALFCHSKYMAPAACLKEYLGRETDTELLCWRRNESSQRAAYNRMVHLAERDDLLLVRYGCTALGHMDSVFHHVLNTSEAINRASGDKFAATNALKEAGLPVIEGKTVREYVEHEDSRFDNSPIIARKFSHFGGRDIRLFERIETTADLRSLMEYDYVLRFIPRTREFRVWVFHTRSFDDAEHARPLSVKIAEKVDNGSIDRASQTPSQKLVKNHRNGYSFMFAQDIPGEVRTLGKRAVELFGLDFGAVDVMQDLDTGNFYILEVNTAPGCLTDSTASGIGNKILKAHRHIMGVEDEESE